MANKIDISNILRPAPTTPEDEAFHTALDQFTPEQAGREIDNRFREALRRGETSGDFVILDEYGNEIVAALPSKSILDF